MKRASWMIGSLTALALAGCGGGSSAGNAGAGTETGSPGMAADTAPAPGAMDTALTDTTSATTDTTAK